MLVQESSRKRCRNAVPSSSKVTKTLDNADRENKHCISSLPTYNVKVISTVSTGECRLLINLFINHYTSSKKQQGRQLGTDCRLPIPSAGK